MRKNNRRSGAVRVVHAPPQTRRETIELDAVVRNPNHSHRSNPSSVCTSQRPQPPTVTVSGGSFLTQQPPPSYEETCSNNPPPSAPPYVVAAAAEGSHVHV